MTSLFAAMLGSSWRFLMDTGGAVVALPRPSARRARLLPEVFDDFSCVGRKLSSRVSAIIRKMNQTAFALSFLETGGVARAERPKVEYAILCANSGSIALHCLHSVIF